MAVVPVDLSRKVIKGELCEGCDGGAYWDPGLSCYQDIGVVEPVVRSHRTASAVLFTARMIRDDSGVKHRKLRYPTENHYLSPRHPR